MQRITRLNNNFLAKKIKIQKHKKFKQKINKKIEKRDKMQKSQKIGKLFLHFPSSREIINFLFVYSIKSSSKFSFIVFPLMIRTHVKPKAARRKIFFKAKEFFLWTITRFYFTSTIKATREIMQKIQFYNMKHWRRKKLENPKSKRKKKLQIFVTNSSSGWVMIWLCWTTIQGTNLC